MLLASCFENYLYHLSLTSSTGNYDHNFVNLRVIHKYFTIEKIFDSSQLNQEVIHKFIIYLKIKNNNANSINKKIGALKRALLYNDILIPGVTNFKKLSYKKKLWRVVPDDVLAKILLFIRSNKESPIALTRYILIMLFLYTGSRLSELLAIKIENIDMNTCSITLDHTKSGIPRLVFFNQSIIEDLNRYINLKPDREYLFYNFRKHIDRRLDQDHVEHIFKYIKNRLGLIKFTPHMLRHTMATLLIRHGASLKTVQDLLGLASISTTNIYLSVLSDFLYKDYNDHFPKL